MSAHHKHNKHHNKHNKHGNKHLDAGVDEEHPEQHQEPAAVTMLELSANEVESLHNNLNKLALPILLGTDSNEIFKWSHHTGKSLETGMFYSGYMPGYGQLWKLEFVIDCPAEVYYKAMAETFDVSWIPFLGDSEVLKKCDEYAILHQKIEGAPAVSDRDVLVIQFHGISRSKKTPTSPEETIYYAITQSLPDGNYYNPTPWPGCVRAEYQPQGWSWKPFIDEDGRMRTFSILIYNLDLKGYLPKFIVNFAATTFLSRHVKAAQQHGLKLAERDATSSSTSVIIPTHHQ